MKQSVYITTTLPYVNADPHIGFALEIIQADALARFYRLSGREVFFNTGTDEHGLKIYRKSQESGLDPKSYVDQYAERFDQLRDGLNLSYDSFIRTTDGHHIKAAQAFWEKCAETGDIYKKEYKVKYCVGCELEKTDSELVDGACPIHPNQPIELIEEENYFFRFSKYGQSLIDLYNSHSDLVVPEYRLNEIKKFVERGLEDFSISRLKEKMPWGVPVPGDPHHVMYVWFDALVNYVSAVGWPEDMDRFNHWWPVIQLAGKDNLRQQAAIWQAMLLSAGLPPSRQIMIHGFMTSEGQKMSKSLGNVIDPFELVKEYGTDAVRYYLLRHVHPFEDSDFTAEKFKDVYNANLANGLGNLVSRIMKMAETHLTDGVELPEVTIPDEVSQKFEAYEFNQVGDYLWDKISGLDQVISDKQPFALVKTKPEEAKAIIKDLVIGLYRIGVWLEPLLPETSAKITNIVKSHKKPMEPLFLRRD